MLDDALFAEHVDLQRTIQDVLRRTLPPLTERAVGPRRTVAADQLWSQLTEIGVPGLGVEEDAGGVGGGLAELAVVSRELGRALAPVSVAPQRLAAVVLAAASGAGDLLRDLAAGHRVSTGNGDLGADRFSGRIAPVVDPSVAGRLVLWQTSATDSEGRIAVVELGTADVSLDVVDDVAVMRTAGVVTATNAALRVIDCSSDATATALAEARVLLSYEMLGAAESVLGMAADHAGSREQFGRPIGTFQAVSHRLAAAFIELQAAAASASLALRAREGDGFEMLASVGRDVVAESLVECCEAAVQVLGAIGFTWEHPLHYYVKYAKTTQRLWESESGAIAELVSFLEVSDR